MDNAFPPVLQALTVAAELTGTTLSPVALDAMDRELERWPEQAVLRALDRCRRELTGRLTLAAIIERIEQDDGRPGADEAWAIAQGAQDERETVVWSAEIRDAFLAAKPVLELGDKVGARMAFLDAYRRLVREARESGKPAHWEASLGWDAELRQKALATAAQAGRLAGDTVAGLLPGPKPALQLEDKSKPAMSEEQRLANLARIRETLAGIGGRQEQQRAETAAARRADNEQRRQQVLADIERMRPRGAA